MVELSYCGDALTLLQSFPENRIQMCVTSPPYWGLRDYGVEGQLGVEKTPDEYVQRVVAVFREVRRVLKNDGTLWLNLGDSYANDGKWGGTTGGKHAKGLHGEPIGRRVRYTGLKPKDLVGIPWMVAFALRADGWYLRQDIIWHKRNAMPESVKDRCTKSHEYLFLLSKSVDYLCDMAAVKEPAVCGYRGSEFHTGKTGEHQLGRSSRKPRSSGNKSHKFVTKYEYSTTEEHRTKAGLLKISDTIYEMRNRRSVWDVPTKPYKGAHFATFPPALVEPCILAGSRPGDLILDPFGGSGTVGQVAKQHNRGFVLIDLNPTYCELSRKRIYGEALSSEEDNVLINTDTEEIGVGGA